MECTIKKHGVEDVFYMTVNDIPKDQVNKLQDAVNNVLFGITPAIPQVPGCFFLEPKYVQEFAITMYKTGARIDAVKFIRVITGWGLKDAKDFCDQLVEKSGPFNVSSPNALDLKNFAITRGLKF